MRNVLLLAAAMSSGCITDLDDSEVLVMDDESEEAGTSERVALNGLTSFSTNLTVTPDSSQLRTVAQGSLTSAGSRVPTLFSTAAGRERFAYLVSCAERAGYSVKVTANGKTYTFPGSMGLAVEWRSTALSTSSYKLISACMMARTNYTGAVVSISMRHSKLSTTPTEIAAYTVLEGAFWGDVFTAGGTMRACASPTKLSGASISTLPLRECAVSVDGVTTKCGFSYAGDCTNVCNTSVTAIGTAFGYTSCEGASDTVAVFVAKP